MRFVGAITGKLPLRDTRLKPTDHRDTTANLLKQGSLSSDIPDQRIVLVTTKPLLMVQDKLPSISASSSLLARRSVTTVLATIADTLMARTLTGRPPTLLTRTVTIANLRRTLRLQLIRGSATVIGPLNLLRGKVGGHVRR